MINLTDDSFAILKKCLQKHNPKLIPIIENPNTTEYTEQFYNQLRNIVGDELIAEGFNKDWEPNDYGLELEQLIDDIFRLFM